MSRQTILNYESSAAAFNGASTKGSPFGSPEWNEFSANADKKHAAAIDAAKPVMEKLRRKHHARSDLPTLGRAQKHFDRITSTEPPMSVKGAFRLMLITYCDE